MRSRLSAFGLTAFGLSALALKCVRLNCVRLNCVCPVHLGEGACWKPTPMGGLVIRPRWIRLCARIRAISAAFIRRGFDWKLLLKNGPAVLLLSRSRPRVKKGADHRPSARRWPGYIRWGTESAQTALMGLITALGQKNKPKWASRAVVSRGDLPTTTQTETTGFLV